MREYECPLYYLASKLTRVGCGRYDTKETMPVTISDEVLTAAHISEPELKQELALTLFQQERLTNPRGSQPSCGDEPARLSGAAGGTPNSDSLRNTGVPRGPSDSAPNGTSLIVVSDTSPVLNLARIDLLERCGRFIAKCSFPPPYIGN